MSRVIKVVQRVIFVISTQSILLTESLAESLRAFSPLYAKSEPLLLLLSGIVMFVGATTIQRAVKKTSLSGYRAGRGLT